MLLVMYAVCCGFISLTVAILLVDVKQYQAYGPHDTPPACQVRAPVQRRWHYSGGSSTAETARQPT